MDGILNLLSQYKDFFHPAASRIIYDYEISPTPWCECSPVGQPEPFCGRKRRYTQGKFRFKPAFNSPFLMSWVRHMFE